MGSVGSNRSVSPLAKSYSAYVDSFVGWNVCVQRRNDKGDEYSIGGEDVNFLKYVEKMGRGFNLGR